MKNMFIFLMLIGICLKSPNLFAARFIDTWAMTKKLNKGSERSLHNQIKLLSDNSNFLRVVYNQSDDRQHYFGWKAYLYTQDAIGKDWFQKYRKAEELLSFLRSRSGEVISVKSLLDLDSDTQDFLYIKTDVIDKKSLYFKVSGPISGEVAFYKSDSFIKESACGVKETMSPAVTTVLMERAGEQRAFFVLNPDLFDAVGFVDLRKSFEECPDYQLKEAYKILMKGDLLGNMFKKAFKRGAEIAISFGELKKSLDSSLRGHYLKIRPYYSEKRIQVNQLSDPDNFIKPSLWGSFVPRKKAYSFRCENIEDSFRNGILVVRYAKNYSLLFKSEQLHVAGLDEIRAKQFYDQCQFVLNDASREYVDYISNLQSLLGKTFYGVDRTTTTEVSLADYKKCTQSMDNCAAPGEYENSTVMSADERFLGAIDRLLF